MEILIGLAAAFAKKAQDEGSRAKLLNARPGLGLSLEVYRGQIKPSQALSPPYVSGLLTMDTDSGIAIKPQSRSRHGYSEPRGRHSWKDLPDVVNPASLLATNNPAQPREMGHRRARNSP